MLGGDPDATGSSLRLVLAHASALTARLLRVLRSSSSGGIGHDFNCRSPTPLQPTIRRRCLSVPQFGLSDQHHARDIHRRRPLRPRTTIQVTLEIRTSLLVTNLPAGLDTDAG